MDIVYIAAGSWESILQRTQALAIELSQRHRVLYVNSVLHSVPGMVRRALRHEGPARCGLRAVRENLSVLDLVPGVPGSCNSDVLNRMNLRWQGWQLRRWVKKLGLRDYILWIATPWAARLADHLDPLLLCYDCMDNVPAFYRDHRRELVRSLEVPLLRRSDLVLVTAEPLRAGCRAFNSAVHLVRNGVWNADYRNAVPAAELESLPHPVFGFVGYLGNWIDQEAIAALAQRFPRGSLVLVGPVHTNVARLERLPNVHFTGRVPHNRLPSYIQAFDVGLIPFVLDDLAAAVDPVKFYEYCAAGKPVVATALPELARHGELCYLANATGEFILRVEEALAELADPDFSTALAERRRRLAAGNSWTERAARIDELLRHCSGKSPAVLPAGAREEAVSA